MSGSSTPRANAPAPPKQMSSRLLTMKFMQRAASTNSKSTANRPISVSQPTTPGSEPASKRQKTEHTPDSSTPTTPATEPRAYASRSDIKAAIQAESAFEALARAKRSELGFGHNEYETEWILNVPVAATNNTPDINNGEDESESEQEQVNGRQTYGGFKRRNRTTTGMSTPGSKLNTPAQLYKFDDFDSDEDEEESEDGEVGSEEDDDRRMSRSGSGKKRKAARIDEDDQVAMSALDRVDLSKTGYARAKTSTPTAKNWKDYGKGNQGKQQGKNRAGKRKGKKR